MRSSIMRPGFGREEGQNEMIRSMWKAGISEEQIASIAQKTVEEVRKLCK